MLFDYPERQLAYDQIRQEVEKYNYQARILGMGGFSDGLLLAVHDFSDRSRSFVIHLRERGWFLRPQDPTFYSIPPHAVLETCLAVLNLLESSPSQAACQWLRKQKKCDEVSPVQWTQDDEDEIDFHWRQHGWKPLSPENEVGAWVTFENWHRDHVLPKKGKVLGDSYSQGWDLSNILEGNVDENKLETPITLELLSILKSCGPEEFPLYAFDRQHPTYLFDPCSAKPIATRTYWAVPFLPLDNDYFFVSQCYSYGIVGSYNPKQLIVFGDKMRAFQNLRPELFLKGATLILENR